MPRPIMVAGGEHCQLRAAIEVLEPYTSASIFRTSRGPDVCCQTST
jgi:hypothetical protein